MAESKKHLGEIKTSNVFVAELITFCESIAAPKSSAFAECFHKLNKKTETGDSYLMLPVEPTAFPVFTELMQCAAEAEITEGQYMLAVWLHSGQFKAPDIKQAFHWYQKAAEQGH